MNNREMPNWLDKRASLTPKRVCLTDGAVVWTFEDLNQYAQATARKLHGREIGRGDRVAVLLGNSFRVPQIIYALQYLDAITVLLNNRLAPAELGWQLKDAGCKLLIYDDEFLGTVAAITADIPRLGVLSYAAMEQLPGADVLLERRIDLDAVHTVIYTSGTTGRPKGVMLTNENHWWSATGSVLNLGLQMTDQWLICVPMFHMSGLSIILRSVIYGIPVLIQRKFIPAAVNEAIRDEGVTMVSVVSSMLAQMLENLGQDGYPDSFRCMLVGGGPVPAILLQECRKKQIPVYQTYGLTETASQLVTLSPEYMDSKLGSAGKALFPAEIKIEGDGGGRKPGEVGEIVVRGPTVTPGYLNIANEKLDIFRDGWFHTGDLGYIDEEGFLYVLDRRSDLIISGGENVYPAEIEAVLNAHPAIAEAGVTGVKHEQWGQVPVAFIKINEQSAVTEEEVRLFCRERLAHYKCPTRVYFVEKLPRNAANKLLRRKLAELIR
ncbi:amp-dependent synthetase/ligase [Lucifera butyrica]|uniref:2-succinylbenzoate--CoA ligase n=1 Tax=Lucifera butyrica TaxID=1351585 RepID=A0A498R7H2_9FIRM|nr:o-succinylbenzoate--CoA ligase [Lucifera butyrica]VBB06113.1 amp-dependent synthetase/ligase [Lucifera butyrica]